MSKEVPVRELIPEAESRGRQAAVDFAWASVGLEGFNPSEEDEQRAARFIAGEIDLAELFVELEKDRKQ
jgi:hypothetical protein